jgi:hypothetical protein
VTQVWGPGIGEGAVRVGLERTPPPGWREVERYHVVPHGRRPMFLVPAAGRRTAAASTCAYNGLRLWRLRAARRAAGTGLRVGLGQLLPSTLTVCVPERLPASAEPQWLLLRHLGEVLQQPVVAGIGVRAGGGAGKPTLQLFDRSGRSVGFAKVGGTRAGRRLVRHEADVLRRLALPEAGRTRVPGILHDGEWHDRYVSVAAPLPERVRMHREFDRLPDPPVILGLSVAPDVRMYWAGLRDRATAARAGRLRPETGTALAAIADRLDRQAPDPSLPLAAAHGDWVPWNMAWHRRDLWAWDWEYFMCRAPLGFDHLHWHFQVEFVHRGRPLPAAMATAERRAAPALARLRLSSPRRRLLGGLYLLEIGLRALELQEQSDRWAHRVTDALPALLADREESRDGRAAAA